MNNITFSPKINERYKVKFKIKNYDDKTIIIKAIIDKTYFVYKYFDKWSKCYRYELEKISDFIIFAHLGSIKQLPNVDRTPPNKKKRK